MKRIGLLVFGLVALMAAGCQALEIGVITGRSGASIEITVSDEELNAALAESITASETDSGVSFTPTVTFDNGSITLSATLSDETGASASGNATFMVTQEDNQLRVYATQVSLVGTDSAGNQALNLQVAINRAIAAELEGQTGATFEPIPNQVYVESIELVPGEMVVTVRLPG
jgi:hypothetical protein